MTLHEGQFFFNREVSWLRFNERVLEEAEDATNPPLERLKFLSIFSSNLDEFFMIRVAGLKEQIEAGVMELSPDGLAPQEQLKLISDTVRPLIERQYIALQQDLIPKLEHIGVFFGAYNNLTPEQRARLDVYFTEKIFPVLTPLAVDSAHPIPQLRPLTINLLASLKTPFEDEAHKMAVVTTPATLARFVQFDLRPGYLFVPLEQIIEAHIGALFPNMSILNITQFRLIRNADLDISEAEADDLLKLIERQLRKRRLGTIIRLEVSETMHPDKRSFLKDVFELDEIDIYPIRGFMGVDTFLQLHSAVELGKDAPFTPVLHQQVAESENIFEAIRKRDFLLHHPYDSFQPVVSFIQAASKDPAVVAIKQTLYRTTGRSPIVLALKEAAENGKQVTALIELKARFNEEANITWAKELEQAGVNVIFGVLGYKTHCKLALVLREEAGQIRAYVHLGTGNYNEKTALVYTDFGFFTCNPAMGKDVAELFNLLTGFSRQEYWRKIFVAPVNLRELFLRLISECAYHHTPEAPSRIRIVMNSLTDPQMIKALYKASIAGVQIDLIIRGICCLIPGVAGRSENITVRSIVGRFLEHTRIYCFEYKNEIKLYSGSADWMQRNLTRRIEVVFPLEDKNIQQQVMDIIQAMLKDNVKARFLTANGSYLRRPEDKKPGFSAHLYFLSRARNQQKSIDTIKKS